MGRNRLPKKILILLMAFTLILEAPFGGEKAFSLSIEDEVIAGERFFESVRRYMEVVDDDYINGYINRLGQYLLTPLETRHFPYRFYVIRDNTLNAFAGPGGHIFIFSGLINAIDEIDEISAVICHEIGHVSARHLSNRLELGTKIAIATLAAMLAGVFIGGQAGSALMTGTMAAGIQKQLAYSREDERQADQMGFKYLEESGFNPSGALALLKKLEKGQFAGPDGIPPYLLTHPGGMERVSNMETMLSGHTPKADTQEISRFRRDFPFFKALLKAKCMDLHEAERFFNMELEKDTGSAPARYGLGVVWLERSEHVKAIGLFQEVLKSQPDALPILRSLGEAFLLSGQDKEAIRILEKANQSDNQDKGILFLLGTAYQQLGDYPKATLIFERLATVKPVKDEVFYNLGVVYGKQEMLGIAHYYFGVYFKGLKEREKAKFHLQKAETLARNDPSLLRRIKEAQQDPLFRKRY